MIRQMLSHLWWDFSRKPIAATSAFVLVGLSLIQPDSHRADHMVLAALLILLSRDIVRTRDDETD